MIDKILNSKIIYPGPVINNKKGNVVSKLTTAAHEAFF